MARRAVEGRQTRIPRTCRSILAYLAGHPLAGDTAEGILQWWVMERQLIEEQRAVQRALDYLVRRDWLLVVRAEDSRCHYRLNDKKGREIQKFLEGAKSA